MENEQPPNLEENLPFCKARTVVQHTSAGQFTENVRKATSDTPKFLMKLRPWLRLNKEFVENVTDPCDNM